MKDAVISDDVYKALCLCENACIEFVRKVDCGKARSIKSYTQMKMALQELDRARVIEAANVRVHKIEDAHQRAANSKLQFDEKE